MDIIVTTPKTETMNAAREAADVIANGGGYYFRYFGGRYPKRLSPGDRVYYVEDGFITGFALVHKIEHSPTGVQCETTGLEYRPGAYVWMDATTWQWIKPIPFKGFQGFRYFEHCLVLEPIEIVGGWRDPKPFNFQPGAINRIYANDHQRAG